MDLRSTQYVYVTSRMESIIVSGERGTADLLMQAEDDVSHLFRLVE